MKKTILSLSLILITCVSIFGQNDTSNLCPGESKIFPYVSYGLSVTNSQDFKSSSYTSLEGGVMYENLSFGLMIGRGSLAGLGSKQDRITDYFYELKTSASFPLGMLSGSILLGYGGYIDTKHMFIEYGVGLSYTPNKIGYGLSLSNWDGINYITPFICYNF